MLGNPLLMQDRFRTPPYIRFLLQPLDTDTTATYLADETGKSITYSGVTLSSDAPIPGLSSFDFSAASGQSVVCGTVADALLGTGPFTVELFMKWSYGTYIQTLLDNSSTSYNSAWALFAPNSSSLSWRFTDSIRVSVPSTSLPKDTWHHLAYVRRVNGTCELYVNGVSVDTGTDSYSYSTALGSLILGKRRAAAGSYSFRGKLSAIRICVGVEVYTANFTPPTTAFPTS